MLGIVLLTMLLNACGTTGSETVYLNRCPPLAQYSAEQQARAADELEDLGTEAALMTFMKDYGLLREQCRIIGKGVI